MEDTIRVGRRTTHAAMDVDETGGEVRINPAQGLTVEAVVQRQVLSFEYVPESGDSFAGGSSWID